MQARIPTYKIQKCKCTDALLMLLPQTTGRSLVSSASSCSSSTQMLNVSYNKNAKASKDIQIKKKIIRDEC